LKISTAIIGLPLAMAVAMTKRVKPMPGGSFFG
jgi:hypothetical protein